MRDVRRLAIDRPLALGSDRAWRALWGAAGLLLLAWLARSAVSVLLADSMVQVQHTPDDAYYYLGLARAFAGTGRWSFDGGVSATSGFHPLFAYLLAGVYRLAQPGVDGFVRLGVGLTALLTVAALLWAWWLAWRTGRPEGLLLVALLAGSRHVALNAVSAVEWPLVVLCALGYGWLFWRGVAGRVTRWLGLALGLAGLLGSLARTDFGLWPFCLFLTGVVLATRERRRELARLAALGLLGAVAGVGLTLAHSALTTGDWLQSSARMKALWSAAQGGSLVTALGLPGQIVGLEDGVLGLLGAAGGATVALLMALGLWRRARTEPASAVESRRALVFLGASVLCAAGYTLFYARSGSVQPWYSANLIAPVVTVLYLLLVSARWRWGRGRVLAIASLGVLLLVGGGLLDRPVAAPAEGPWPHQAVMLATARTLAAAPPDGPVGAWNAGILGYYQGGGVINLDGLVNNDIYPYAATNRLAAYIDRQGIRYIVDFARMVEDPGRRRRGGYDDPAFLARLEPLRVFDARETGWRRLTLWAVGP